MLKVKQLESQKNEIIWEQEGINTITNTGYGDIFLSTMNLMCSK